MTKPLAVLIVEDSESDAQLVVRQLEKAGNTITFEQVETAAQMRAALEKQAWEIVISDYCLPEFDGHAALMLLLEMKLDIPLIAVSGTMGEEAAVDMMKAGAHDYVMKGNLARLVPAVERELAQAEVRRERKLAEEALRESNAFNTMLLQTIPFGMDIVSEIGQILFINPALEQILGKETLGKRCWDQYKDDKQQCVACPLKNEIKPGQTAIIETTGVLGGRVFEICHTGIIFHEQKAVLEVFHDITELKRTQAVLQISETGMRTIIESSSDGFEIVDGNGIVRFVNPTVEALFGRPAKQLMGAAFGFAIEEKKTTELEISRPDGSTCVVEMQTADIVWEGQPVYLASLRDITARRNIEQAEKEIAKMKATFIAGVTHDLRTPLTSLMGFLKLMKSDKEMNGAIQDEFLDLALQDAERLASLTGDILEASQLESVGNKIKLFDVDLCNLITVSLKALEGIARDKGITLHDDFGNSPLNIKADRRTLRRVLDNLIGNAIRYSNHGGAVHVRAARTMAGVLVEVIDQGIGIPEKELPLLFQKFYQGDTLVKRSGAGTGLGLYIAKEIVEAHGGTIGVESKPGVGSVFHFTIPVIEELVSEVSK